MSEVSSPCPASSAALSSFGEYVLPLSASDIPRPTVIAHANAILPGEPRAGRMVPEISNPDIGELLFKKYRIVYRVRKGSAEILIVFEGHRLLRVAEIGP